MLVIVKGTLAGAIAMDSGCVPTSAGLEASFAVTVKLDVPLVEGVPLIVPLGESDKPAGSLPSVTDQVNAVACCVAVNVCEYVTPITPFGTDVVVILGGILTVRSCSSHLGLLLLVVTRTLKENVPPVVGVPLI